jgi:hypothetical protein
MDEIDKGSFGPYRVSNCDQFAVLETVKCIPDLIFDPLRFVVGGVPIFQIRVGFPSK